MVSKTPLIGDDYFRTYADKIDRQNELVLINSRNVMTSALSYVINILILFGVCRAEKKTNFLSVLQRISKTTPREC